MGATLHTPISAPYATFDQFVILSRKQPDYCLDANAETADRSLNAAGRVAADPVVAAG
jgi:hypothetical protein